MEYYAERRLKRLGLLDDSGGSTWVSHAAGGLLPSCHLLKQLVVTAFLPAMTTCLVLAVQDGFFEDGIA
jgi:hypothetical protein